jgi:hypothetical protein
MIDPPAKAYRFPSLPVHYGKGLKRRAIRNLWEARERENVGDPQGKEFRGDYEAYDVPTK